jgi:gluconokinase
VHSQRTYPLTVSQEGEVSVDADALEAVVCQTISEALAAAGSMVTQIGAVAIDTFWHSLMGVDADGTPVTPVITWEDTRAHGAALELREHLDETAVHARTGARFHASYWPAKLRWMAKQQPEIFSRVAQWLSFGEYLQRKLLGRSVCSLSMAAGTGMLNIPALAWDNELMQVLHVRPGQMPQLGDVHDSIQGLTPGYAAMWPPLHNVPWFPAIGDGASACIGSNCATIENWSLTIGTSSAMRVVVPPGQVVPPLGLWLYLIDAKRAVLGGALSEGGNMLTWMDSTFKLPDLRDVEPLVAAVMPDAHGLTLLPFIAGERSLGWHSDARMTVTGISTHTSPADLLRAGMEALAYQLGAVYTQLRETLKVGEKVPKIICSGGALLGSPTLQGVIADTLGAALYPSFEHEASARGAALLALESLGIIPDVALVTSRLGTPIMPDTEHTTIYKVAAERQRRFYHHLLGEE